MEYRVFDDRTNETLYSNQLATECARWIDKHIDEDSKEYEHIWIEVVK